MTDNKTIGFIGAGNMAETLLSGLISSNQAKPEHIVCADVRTKRLAELKARHGIRTTADNKELINLSDVVIYAVKPQNMAEVMKESAPVLDKSKLIISIAAGVPLEAIEALIGSELRVIRVMPNLCVAVKEGASAMVPGPNVEEQDIELASSIFNAVGCCVHIKEDRLLDAVTGLSGSGPAYVFMMAEALADGGVKMGLSRREAQKLAAQTLLGAAKMLLETKSHPAELKDMVTSPAGTTITGLHVLEKAGIRDALITAVEAAGLRSKELGAMVIEKFRGHQAGTRKASTRQ